MTHVQSYSDPKCHYGGVELNVVYGDDDDFILIVPFKTIQVRKALILKS